MKRGAPCCSCMRKQRNGFTRTCSSETLLQPAREYLKQRGITIEVAKSLAARFRARELGCVSEVGARARLQTRHHSAKRTGQTAG